MKTAMQVFVITDFMDIPATCGGGIARRVANR
jgi:hypothetical protein